MADDHDRGAAGLPPDEHAAWAAENLDSMQRHLRRFETGLDRGVCRIQALMRAYRDNYGVLINAKDAGMEEAAERAEQANAALEHMVGQCYAAMRRACGEVLPAVRSCAAEYRRIRPILYYEGGG